MSRTIRCGATPYQEGYTGGMEFPPAKVNSGNAGREGALGCESRRRRKEAWNGRNIHGGQAAE